MELSTRTRRALSTALALVLAVESVSAVAAAAAARPVVHELPAQPPAGSVLAAEAAPQPAIAAGVEVSTPASPARSAVRVVEPADAATAGAGVARAVEAARAAASASDRRPEARDTATPAREPSKGTAPGTPAKDKASGSPSKASYRGTNHVWIPALGISRAVRWFPCDRTREPDNFMYRWGCAGANNVYLMGHAYSIMKPLHDAYVSGRLAKGMKAWYADANGRVRVYSVRWWKVTRPTTDAAWAWAGQDVPSMTLQTCVGKNSEFRLMVRLVEVGR